LSIKIEKINKPKKNYLILPCFKKKEVELIETNEIRKPMEADRVHYKEKSIYTDFLDVNDPVIVNNIINLMQESLEKEQVRKDSCFSLDYND